MDYIVSRHLSILSSDRKKIRCVPFCLRLLTYVNCVDASLCKSKDTNGPGRTEEFLLLAINDDIGLNVIPFPVQRNPASGIFIWVIATDMVYCDDAAAGLFGFDGIGIQTGLPLRHFLERIHGEDLPRVAGAIHEAMITGYPFQEDYRINHPDGMTVDVTAFGSCFGQRTGSASHYAGMIVPAAPPESTEDGLLDLCLKAYASATRQGKTPVAQKLLDALAELTEDADHDEAEAQAIRE